MCTLKFISLVNNNYSKKGILFSSWMIAISHSLHSTINLITFISGSTDRKLLLKFDYLNIQQTWANHKYWIRSIIYIRRVKKIIILVILIITQIIIIILIMTTIIPFISFININSVVRFVRYKPFKRSMNFDFPLTIEKHIMSSHEGTISSTS